MTTFIGNIKQNKYIAINYKNQKVVHRFSIDNEISEEEAQLIFVEMLKFLFIRSVSKQAILVPSSIVSKMWQAFILHTKDYENYCHYYLGQYIHHQYQTEKDNIYSYEQTKNEIKNSFKELPEEIWKNNENEVLTSAALQKDIFYYQLPTSKIIKKSKQGSGCVELIVSFFLISIVLVLFFFIWFSSY